MYITWQKLTTALLSFYTLVRLLLAALAVYGIWSVGTTIYRKFHPEPPTIIRTITPAVRTIEVPVEKIVTNTVTEYVRIEDRAMVNTLLEENARLHADVARLTIAYGERISNGTVTPVLPNVPATPDAPAPPIRYADWRLSFTITDSATIDYTLTQKFALAVTSGVTRENVPVSLASLYEIGPGETRTEIPITETTYIVANKPTTRWYRKLTLQGGVLVQDDTLVAIAAGPWLKRGRTTAPADTRWAIATPAVTFNTTSRSIGLLPVSFNLGTVPKLRSVITDIWVSPYIGTNNLQSVTHRGVVFTVTF